MSKIKKLSTKEMENVSGGATVFRNKNGFTNKWEFEVWSGTDADTVRYLYGIYDSREEADLRVSFYTSWENLTKNYQEELKKGGRKPVLFERS